MSFDWNKVCSADDYISTLPRSGVFGTSLFLQNSTLTSKCDQLNQELTQEIHDAENHILEIDNFYDEITNLQEICENKIEDKMQRLAELEDKKENGTITRSEEMEIEIIQTQIASFRDETKSKTAEINDKINTKFDSMPTLETQNNISTDYANKTLDISEEFRNANHNGHTYYYDNKKVSASFFADKSKDAAEKLLETVAISENTINVFSHKK